MIGIYKIVNKVNGKMYIGQSVNIAERWKNHKIDAKSKDFPLYRAIRKYGLDNFLFEVIEQCRIEELDDKEIYWIKFYNTYDNGYNCTIGGQGAAKCGQKLTNAQVIEIIDKLQNSDILQKDLAVLYNVGEDTISEINQGKTWVQDDISYPIRKNSVSNLCPYCGKQILKESFMCNRCKGLQQRRVSRPSREELKTLIRNNPFVQIGEQFGVSDNAIRKWCKAEGLPTKVSDIKKIPNEEWEII